jgi:hypothetical protein
VADHLAKLSPSDLASFYKRLADFTDELNKSACGSKTVCLADSLAANLLRKWLNNRSKNTVHIINPPSHLKSSQEVKDTLHFHRRVFLSDEKARIGPKFAPIYKWAGVLPRLKKLPGFKPWIPGTRLQMHYESNVQHGKNKADISRIQLSGTPAEKDLLTSLRGWSLRSNITLAGTNQPNNKVKITFVDWACSGQDLYDFSKVKGLTLPNPDYKKTFSGAVRPDDISIKIYHTNAIRLENAGLAAPYKVVIKNWFPQDVSLKKTAVVDINREL